MQDIIRVFLKIGFFGFGGPFATIAMMEDEAVKRRGWVTPQTFTQILSVVKIFPGATATQVAVFLGRARAGVIGGVVAGLLFILPSFAMILLLAVFYEQLKTLPRSEGLFRGMQIAAVVIIAESVSRMSKPYARDLRAVAIALISAATIFVSPRSEPLVILGFGLAGLLQSGFFSEEAFGFFSLKLMGPAAGALPSLVGVFLKAGFLAFGTGLAIVPLLEADVVGHYHWLSHGEFLDALAAGQITPGPVLITAAYIGYKVSGFIGALTATVCVFGSAFFNILVVLPLIVKKVAGSPKLKIFADWAFPAVIGGIVATTVKLTLISVNYVPEYILLVVTAAFVFWKRPPSWIVVPLAGLGYFASEFLVR